MSVISRELPAPKNWQEFENLAFDVYRRMWKTNDAEMHGRQGQPQSGVDVYGMDRVEQRFTGVQCKGKDGDLDSAVTAGELRAEVLKARTFQPPLDVFVLATTAPNDQAIQKVAREITAEHSKSGLFEVRVTGWTTLRNYVSDFQDVLSKYYQDLAPLDVVAQIADTAEQQVQGFAQTEKMLRTTMRMIADVREGQEGGDQLATRIAEISKLIGDGSPRAAIKALDRIQAEEGEIASPLAKYRLLASLGNAYYALGEEQRAIELFHASYEANPDFANAQATQAMALALEGNRSEAEPLAEAAYRRDPTSARNASIWIDTLPPSTPIAEIESALTSELLQDADIQLHLALQSHENGDDAGHRRYAEAALRLAPNDWRMKSAVAEALMQPLSGMDGLALTHDLQDYREDVERAVTLMQSAWATLAERDSSFQGRHVAANLIGLLGLLGRDSEAEQVLDQALSANPGYAPLVLISARQLSSRGDWRGVADALDEVAGDELTFDALLLRTQAALQLSDATAASVWSEKLGEGRGSEAEIPERSELIEAMRTRADILNGADRNTAIAVLLAKRPDSIIVRSIIFDDLAEDDPLRVRLVAEIESLAGADISLRERIHAAETLYASGHYSLAADLYALLHSTVDGYALRRRLQALHLADRRAEARRLFESIPPDLRVSDAYLGLGVAIYERAGLLKPALKLVERALEGQDVLRNRLTWVHLLIRLGRAQQMQSWLSSVPEVIDGTPSELLSLAHLVDRYIGGDPRALSLGYRALRGGYGKPRIHLGYALGLMVSGRSGDLPMAAPQTVEPACGVVLINEAAGETLHRIIETGPAPVIERDEISPDDPFAKRLIGLRVGDTIEFAKAGVGQQTYRVAEIQTRYLFAFRRTMRQFNTLFPDNPAFGSFTIDDSKGDDRFEELFSLARRRAEQGKQLERNYRDGVVPIALFARFAGGSVFDIWDNLSKSADTGLKVALGVAGEFEAGREAAARGLSVVDPISIYAWAQMGLVSLFGELRGRLAVVQSTVDLLRQLTDERAAQRGRKVGTFGYDGERYVVVELTEEQVERQIEVAKVALKLADDFPLVPSETNADLPEKILNVLGGLHSAFHDSIIASLEPGRALLTDDFGFRIVAQAAGAAVTWTQCFAQYEQNTRRLSHPDYRRVINTLLDTNYRFVQFGAADIVGELQDSSWRINDRLRRFARLLTSSTVDRMSVISVLGDLFLQSREQAPFVSSLAEFPKEYMKVSRDNGREKEARDNFTRATILAQSALRRLINRKTLPPKLLGSSYLMSPEHLAADAESAAAREMSRLWQDLRTGGLDLQSQ